MTVVAVSLKMYFERQRTLDYVDRVARIAAGSGAVVSGAVTLAVYTDFLTLDAASRTLQAKCLVYMRKGLTRMLGVGVPERTAPEAAAATVVEQIRSALGAQVPDQDLWIGYEPYWAIGAPAPAPADEVRAVCTAVRERLAGLAPRARLLYGGSAGPGLLTRLAPAVDGVFLGRFAHDPAALAAGVEEAAALP